MLSASLRVSGLGNVPGSKPDAAQEEAATYAGQSPNSTFLFEPRLAPKSATICLVSVSVTNRCKYSLLGA